MATMNISLPDPMKTWVEDQISTGHYSNASDYMRDLIRRDQTMQRDKDVLIQALIAGENSGISERTVDGVWQAAKSRRGIDV